MFFTLFSFFLLFSDSSKVCPGHDYDFASITKVFPINKRGKFVKGCLGCVPCLRHRMDIGHGYSSTLSSKAFIVVEGVVQVFDSTQDVLFYRELVRTLVGIGKNTSLAIGKTDETPITEIILLAHTTIYVPLVQALASFNAYFAPNESIRQAVGEAIFLNGLFKARDELQAFVLGSQEEVNSELLIKTWCSAGRFVQQAVTDTLIAMGSVIQQETSGRCLLAFCRFTCKVKGAT